MLQLRPLSPLRQGKTVRLVTHALASQAVRGMASTAPSSRLLRLFAEQPSFIYGTAWKKD
ncbi:hypothetical protein GQ44DRAFT_716038 [Phaeosphaeriaceae sp. PMI808]|nr:hypothetical protein GQ44DRAFT_716038 [Phaeosphaeriaceae sp. PMI808]